MPRDVYFAQLCGGGSLWEESANAVELAMSACQAEGWGAMRKRGSWSGLARTRNIMVALFRQTSCTDLVFVDRDIAFRAEDLVAMLRSPYEVIGVAYPKRGINWGDVELAVRAGVKAEYLPLFASSPVGVLCAGAWERRATLDGATFLEAEELGTGLLVIRRQALERFIAHYEPDIAYRSDYWPGDERPTHHAVFVDMRDPDDDSPTGRYLTEDYSFCRRWRRMGGELHMLADAHVRHHGGWTFEGCLLTHEQARVAVEERLASERRAVARVAHTIPPEAMHANALRRAARRGPG